MGGHEQNYCALSADSRQSCPQSGRVLGLVGVQRGSPERQLRAKNRPPNLGNQENARSPCPRIRVRWWFFRYLRNAAKLLGVGHYRDLRGDDLAAQQCRCRFQHLPGAWQQRTVYENKRQQPGVRRELCGPRTHSEYELLLQDWCC